MKNPPLSLLVVIALAAAVAGYYGYRQFGEPAAGAAAPLAQAPPARTAVNVPAEPPAATVADQVPDVQLVDLKGKPHALRETPGHARLFNFWATWCEPCLREIPLLNALQGEYGADELQIVGIAVDFREAVKKFIKTTKLEYTSLMGEQQGLEVAQKFGVELALPFSVFADEHNQIIAVKVGELHREEADAILAHMRALRAGTESLADAQVAIGASLRALAIERAKQSAQK